MSDPKSSAKDRGYENNRLEEDVDSLYRMSPSGFFSMEKVQARIDLQQLNHDLLSAAVFHETNQRRKNNGKGTLKHLPRLDEASRMHARDMAEYEYVAHMNPREQELETPLDRVREVGLDDIRFVAENVASHFGMQYESGETIFPMERDGNTEYYYQPGGKPIPNHTYRSFAESLVDDWMSSPGHRRNILSEKSEFLGAGCSMGEGEMGPVKFYCTQLFFNRFGR
jgi:uncharacterized protein YkwD